MLAWALRTKAYRLLTGFGVALFCSCVLVQIVDPLAWSQYAQMMRDSGIVGEIVPTLSEMLRLVVHRDAVWVQFVPEAAGCGWALWYFWTRRRKWDWVDQGLLLLVVSVLCSPYSLFSDEAVLLPSVLTGVFRAESSGRSLLPFGLIAVVAILEVLANIPITSVYYLWTIPAWLAWYLYAGQGTRALQPSIA